VFRFEFSRPALVEYLAINDPIMRGTKKILLLQYLDNVDGWLKLLYIEPFLTRHHQGLRENDSYDHVPSSSILVMR